MIPIPHDMILLRIHNDNVEEMKLVQRNLKTIKQWRKQEQYDWNNKRNRKDGIDGKWKERRHTLGEW